MNNKGFSLAGEGFTLIMLALLVAFVGTIILFVFNPFSSLSWSQLIGAVGDALGI